MGADDSPEVHTTSDVAGESLDAVSVLLVDDEEVWARTMEDVLERGDEAFSVTTANDLQEARSAFDRLDPDCVVCDYWLGQGDGLDLLVHVRHHDPNRPFVLVTGEGSETVATDAIRQQVTDYIRKSAIGRRPEVLVGRVKSAVRTYRAERALARERRSKQAMLEIVTATTSREALLSNFCGHLVTERGYACAWIGSYDPANGLVPGAVAGREDYLEDAIDPDAGPGDSTEPAYVALDRREPHVVAPIQTPRADGAPVAPGNDAPGDHASDWRRAASDRGFRAAAAVPVVHETTLLGVLAVYATEADIIDDHELNLLAEYGETIGYALRTAQWKESLLTASPVTVDVEVTDERAPLVGLCRSLSGSPTVEVTAVIPRADGLLYLAHIQGVSADDLRTAVGRVTEIDAVEVAAENGRCRCELAVSTPTPESVLVEQGARFVGTVVERGVATVTVGKPPEVEVASLGDAVAAVFPNSTVTAFGTDRGVDRPTPARSAMEDLTEKQRQALELAFHGGYYRRPRENSATDLAAKLDVSRSTFTQHLRAAESKVFTWILDDDRA